MIYNTINKKIKLKSKDRFYIVYRNIKKVKLFKILGKMFQKIE